MKKAEVFFLKEYLYCTKIYLNLAGRMRHSTDCDQPTSTCSLSQYCESLLNSFHQLHLFCIFNIFFLAYFYFTCIQFFNERESNQCVDLMNAGLER